MSYIIHTKYDPASPTRHRNCHSNRILRSFASSLPYSSPINHHTGPRITASGSHLSFLSVSLRHVLETTYLFSNYPKIFICKLKYQKLGSVRPDKQAINLEWPYSESDFRHYSYSIITHDS